MAEGVQRANEGLCARYAREIGAARIWLLSVPVESLMQEGVLPFKGALPLLSLEGCPVTCVDVRARAREAHGQGRPAVFDASLTGLYGCQALRLEADALVLGLGEALALVAVSRAAQKVLPGASACLDGLPQAQGKQLQQAEQLVAARERAWCLSSDAAQVVAAYLRCHPHVGEVRYPGLKQDPSFEVAARTLQRGFGPLVDWRMADDPTWHRVACDESDPRQQVLKLEQRLG